MSELMESYIRLMEEYNFLKHEVRRKDKRLYEQWKAGGFIVDTDILSMYPCLETVVETIEEIENN